VPSSLDGPAVELVGLSRRFGTLTAVDGIDLAIQRGELFGLVGPDGAGKTTVLRMLAGILTPTGGDARVGGRSVAREPEAIKPHIAYMSQRFGLYGDLTVLENLHFYADLFEVPRARRGQRIDRLLAAANLDAFRDRLADKLSGGMKQKLGLACALVHTPEIVLLDEPTNGVDPVSRRDFWRLLYEMLKDGVTIVVTTAYLDEAERAHRVALMHAGRLLAVDTPERIRGLVRERLVEIAVTDGWLARRRLEGVPGVLGVTVYGHRVHVRLADETRDLTGLIATLAGAGLQPREPRVVVPALEDVFIAVLEGHAAAPEGHAVAPEGRAAAPEGRNAR
jgi:drug efflux transport system ATP-binding protein